MEEYNKSCETFYFKGYNRSRERESFSAFIPDEEKGIWSIGEGAGEKSNYTKRAIMTIMEMYMEGYEMSDEVMNKILNRANREIVLRRLLKNEDYIHDFSILVMAIKGDRMIAGNIGKTQLRIYRRGNILHRITGNRIMEINLEEKDIIMMGVEKFWELIREGEITERISNMTVLKRYLEEKIKEFIKNYKKEFPFLMVHIENLKDDIQEETKGIEIIYEQEDKVSSQLNFFIVILIFLFLFTAIGKNSNEKINQEKETGTKIAIWNSNLDVYGLKDRKIDIGELKANKEIKEVEEKLAEIPKGKISNSSKKKTRNKKSKSRKIRKSIKTRFKSIKGYDSDLDEEIKKNWEILGRDKNGNEKI